MAILLPTRQGNYPPPFVFDQEPAVLVSFKFLSLNELNKKVSEAQDELEKTFIVSYLELASNPKNSFARACRDAAFKTLDTFLDEDILSTAIQNNELTQHIPDKICEVWLVDFEESLPKDKKRPHDFSLLHQLFCFGVHHLQAFSRTKNQLIRDALANPSHLHPHNFVKKFRADFDISEILACRTFESTTLVSQISAAKFLITYSHTIDYTCRPEESLIVFLKTYCPQKPLHQIFAISKATKKLELTQQAMLEGLSPSLISYFSDACFLLESEHISEEIFEENLDFWDSLGDLVYAFNNLIVDTPLFTSVALFLEKEFKLNPLVSHDSIIETLMRKFQLQHLQATILYKTWWYHPTSESELRGAFENAKECSYYYNATEQFKGALYDSFAYSTNTLGFQKVAPLDRFIDWYVREFLVSKNLWHVDADKFVDIFEKFFETNTPEMLPFNPERVRRTHFDLSRSHRIAMRQSRS